MGFSLFGSSGSSAPTTTDSNNVLPNINTGGGDLGRVAAGVDNSLYGDGAQTSVARIEGSSNVVNMLDAGAVSNSLALALKGVELANEQASAAQTRSGQLLQGVFDAQNSTTKQLASAVESVKTADLKTIGLGALAIVAAVVGIIYMRKG